MITSGLDSGQMDDQKLMLSICPVPLRLPDTKIKAEVNYGQNNLLKSD